MVIERPGFFGRGAVQWYPRVGVSTPTFSLYFALISPRATFFSAAVTGRKYLIVDDFLKTLLFAEKKESQYHYQNRDDYVPFQESQQSTAHPVKKSQFRISEESSNRPSDQMHEEDRGKKDDRKTDCSGGTVVKTCKKL
jgi:hypothetical protein